MRVGRWMEAGSGRTLDGGRTLDMGRTLRHWNLAAGGT